MLKAIFFDAAGTLIYLPRSVGEHYCEVARRFGVKLDEEMVDEAFRSVWAIMPARPSVSNVARADDDKGWWRDLVERVMCQALSTQPADSFDMPGYFEAIYAHFTLPGVWQLFDDVRPTLTAIREFGIPMGIISNFDRRLYTILDKLGLSELFEAVVISSEIGAEKPDRAIFQAALDALGIAGKDAMHVGDDREKDGGASAVGMQVLHLSRPSRGLHQLLNATSLRSE